MCARALSRTTFGQPIAQHGMVQEWIAESRLAIDQARLLVLKTAWLIDTVGAQKARTEIAAIKVAAPRAASYVLDRAIQAYGGGRRLRRHPARRGRGRSCAPCTWPTARTRCTCARSRARSSRPRIDDSHPDAAEAGVRQRILAAAVELFAEHGYDGTSVAQVIGRAGVAKGGFYHHFASKEALLYEVYGDLIRRQLEGMERDPRAGCHRPRRCAR